MPHVLLIGKVETTTMVTPTVSAGWDYKGPGGIKNKQGQPQLMFLALELRKR